MDQNKVEEIAYLVWEKFRIPPCLNKDLWVANDIFYRPDDLGLMFAEESRFWISKAQLFREEFGLRFVFNFQQALEPVEIDISLLHKLCAEFSGQLVGELFPA